MTRGIDCRVFCVICMAGFDGRNFKEFDSVWKILKNGSENKSGREHILVKGRSFPLCFRILKRTSIRPKVIDTNMVPFLLEL